MSKIKKRRKKEKTAEELLAEAVTDLRAWRASRRAWPDTPPGSLAGQRAAALDRVLDAVENGHRIRRPPQPGPGAFEALRDATDTLHDFLSSTAGPRAFQFAIDVSTSRGYPTNGGETTTPPAPEIDPATGEPLEEVRLTPTEAAANAPDRDALRATVALAKADDITRDIRKLLERLTAYRHDRPTEACSSCGTAIPHGRTRCPAADCQTSTQTRPDTCSDCDKAFVPGEQTWHGRCNRCRKRKKRLEDRGEAYVPENQQAPAHVATVDAIQLQANVIAEAAR